MNSSLEVVLVFLVEEYLKVFLINDDKVILKNLIIYLYNFNITFKFRKEVIDSRIEVSTEIIINIKNINLKFINKFLKKFKNRDFRRPGF